MNDEHTELYGRIQECVSFLQKQTDFRPQLGFILGTGLSGLASEIETVFSIDYARIPHFPVSTVESHQGKLIFGYLAGRPVVAMAGRFHFYEGYSMQQLTFPVRVLKFLGIERLIISNAAGSTNPAINMGDIVFVRDHINLQADNPLRGYNDERLGPRFPDMLQTYDRSLNARALAIAAKLGVPAHEGVYVALQGPNLETPAEYHFLHVIGGDLVGMSTVPEVLVARHMELPVLVVSVVSNKCYPLSEIRETSLQDVISAVQAAEPRLKAVMLKLLPSL